MTWLEDADGGLFDVIVTKVVRFALFCSGCLVVPATIIIFWLTLRHEEIRRKPLNWSIVNFALVDLLFGVSTAMQSASFVLHSDILCEISGALTNSLMPANLFSLAAIVAQFDAINRMEEKVLLRIPSGSEPGESPQPAFTVSSVLLINLASWFYVFVAAVPLLVWPSYGPDVIGVCGVLDSTPSVLYACHMVLVSSAIVTCSATIFHYYQRLRRAAAYDASRRVSDISACADLATSTSSETEMALRLIRVSFLTLVGSRTGWFVAEVLLRTMPHSFPLYVGRLLYMLTPLASLINPWVVLFSVEQYRQGIRGEAIASADRSTRLLGDADAQKRFPRIDSNKLHPNSFQYDWRVQSGIHTIARQYFAPPRPLDIHRKSFSQADQMAANYFRSISAPNECDDSS